MTPARASPNEIIFKFSGESSFEYSQINGTLSTILGKDTLTGLHSLSTDPRVYVGTLSAKSDLQTALKRLNADRRIAIAEPNFAIKATESISTFIPNDTFFSQLWNLNNTLKIGSDINVLPLWQEGYFGDKRVVVAVIDTGIDWDHSDLKENIFTKPSNLKINDTISDDIHGWNFLDHNNNSRDDNGHGTHCAGVIGAIGNNRNGVTGINWKVSLLPIKFLDRTGSGTLAGAIESVNYATQMHASIINASWGGSDASELLRASIQKARDAGVIFVAAAGNEGSNNDHLPAYPASYDVENIVSVAATDNRDNIAFFSNFGKKSVHLAAPGVKVLSTYKDGRYEVLGGTSMAAPHVAGIAALILSQNPNWTYKELKNRLTATVDPIRILKRKVSSGGRVNAYNAFHGIIPKAQDPDQALWRRKSQVVESRHPYENDREVLFTVQHEGAKFIRLHFEKAEVEAGFDRIKIQSQSGDEVVDEITEPMTDYTSEWIAGDTAVIDLITDVSNAAYGFKIDYIQIIE